MITEVMEAYDAATDPAMIYYYQNIEEADIRGMDLLLRWRPLSRLEVNASYALVKAHDQKRDRQFTGSRPDRKSTRLNSSHVRISYAVFCLKKKNKSRTNIY